MAIATLPIRNIVVTVTKYKRAMRLWSRVKSQETTLVATLR